MEAVDLNRPIDTSFACLYSSKILLFSVDVILQRAASYSVSVFQDAAKTSTMC
jgi:hypothetical protein